MARKEDVEKYIDGLIETGKWEMISQKNHFKIKHISGRIAVTSRSTSDWRALKNFQSVINRIEKEGEKK
jgi:hypothetical protein